MIAVAAVAAGRGREGGEARARRKEREKERRIRRLKRKWRESERERGRPARPVTRRFSTPSRRAAHGGWLDREIDTRDTKFFTLTGRFSRRPPRPIFPRPRDARVETDVTVAALTAALVIRRHLNP